jgi:hypothetical protein
VVVVGVVIHLKDLVETMRQQAEVLVVAAHTQTRQALLEQRVKDRQAVLVDQAEIIRVAVGVVQRLLAALQQQLQAMAVMAVQALTGNLLELSMRVVAAAVETLLLGLERAGLAVEVMAAQRLLVLMDLLILAAAAVGLETLLS